MQLSADCHLPLHEASFHRIGGYQATLPIKLCRQIVDELMFGLILVQFVHDFVSFQDRHAAESASKERQPFCNARA